MTDLEMTKLCAEAMFDALDWEQRLFEYDPLHDDAQAMALVKKFNIGWDKEKGHEWHLAVRDGNMIFNAHDMNLNRAIVECIANMQKAKQ